MTPEEIRQLRLAYGETQEVFARRVGCAKVTLGTWETGDAVPSPVFARKLARLKARIEKQKEALRERDHQR